MNKTESTLSSQVVQKRGLTLLQLMAVLSFLGIFVTALLRYYFAQ
jgi:hypothetical protein